MAHTIEPHQLLGRALGLGGRGMTIVIVSLAMNSISFLTVVNRISFSMAHGKVFRADDYAIMSSAVSILPAMAVSALFFSRKTTGFVLIQAPLSYFALR